MRATLAALALISSGCALSHERQRADAGQPPRRVCRDLGAITTCGNCGEARCCLHWCQPDGTWSECAYVASECGDAGVGYAPGDSDR